MTSRRALMLATAGLLATQAAARAATTTIALRPGQPRAAIRVRTETLPAGEAFVIAFSGDGAPQDEIRLPTWYGDGRILQAVPVAGREVLLAEFQGNRGTGVAQKLVAAIGCDDDGALRVLGIETLSFRDAQVSNARRRLDGRIEASARRDALLLHHATTGRIGIGPERSERWTTRLRWTGQGILAAPPTPRDAGEIRRRVDRARERLRPILAGASLTDATRIDYDATGIWSVGDAIEFSG
ncbi:hypothetical protein [Roseomonas sp. HF4]|uniref:hypothetical protein n=1 Tax=Roseomonas sp. HF4 TaxID=2562313 RepID=UPI0010C0BF94|nr:hypothetical protein [Roseomonas sp. HF4]